MGEFCFSIDVEGHYGAHKFPAERDIALIKRLLMILRKFRIKATFAFSGTVLCGSSREYLSLLKKLSKESKWDFKSHVPSSFLCAPELASLALEDGHEAASHSFSHVDFDTLGEGPAKCDIKYSKLLLKRFGVKSKSFVFPRNRAGHLALLKSAGFTHYSSFPVPENFLLNYSAFPKTDFPQPVSNMKMIEVPRTAYFYRSDFTEMLRIGMAMRQAKRGFFHLWAHPWNFAEKNSFSALEKIFARSLRLGFESKTMREVSP